MGTLALGEQYRRTVTTHPQAIRPQFGWDTRLIVVDNLVVESRFRAQVARHTSTAVCDAFRAHKVQERNHATFEVARMQRLIPKKVQLA